MASSNSPHKSGVSNGLSSHVGTEMVKNQVLEGWEWSAVGIYRVLGRAVSVETTRTGNRPQGQNPCTVSCLAPRMPPPTPGEAAHASAGVAGRVVAQARPDSNAC